VVAGVRLGQSSRSRTFQCHLSKGAFAYQLFRDGESAPCEPAHTPSGSVGISIAGAYRIVSWSEARCRTAAAQSKIRLSDYLRYIVTYSTISRALLEQGDGKASVAALGPASA
jgi:hypothetical protein